MSPQTTLKTVDLLYELLVWYHFSPGLCTCMALQIPIWWLRLCKCNRKSEFKHRWIKVPRTSFDLLMSPQTTLKTVDFLYEILVWCRFSTGLRICMALQISIWWLRLCKFASAIGNSNFKVAELRFQNGLCPEQSQSRFWNLIFLRIKSKNQKNQLVLYREPSKID